MSILITGSTGKLGHLILQNLVKAYPTHNILGSTRNPSSPIAHSLISQGHTLLSLDFSHPVQTLTSTLRDNNVKTILITSVDKLVGAFEDHKNIIDASKLAGVSKIFYTSQIGAEAFERGNAGRAGFIETHIQTEQYLEESGLRFTSLRNGFYMSSIGFMLGDWKSTGGIIAPEDGKVAWTSHDDLAEGIAKLIMNLDTPKYVTLANGDQWDLNDVAGLLSGVSGKEVKREVVSEEEFKDMKIKQGVPEGMVGFILGGYASMRDGDFVSASKVLEETLGRSCKGLQEFLQEQYGQ
jgi:NAD(P)H dehydrogenase (quinone)